MGLACHVLTENMKEKWAKYILSTLYMWLKVRLWSDSKYHAQLSYADKICCRCTLTWSFWYVSFTFMEMTFSLKSSCIISSGGHVWKGPDFFYPFVWIRPETYSAQERKDKCQCLAKHGPAIKPNMCPCIFVAVKTLSTPGGHRGQFGASINEKTKLLLLSECSA